MRLLLPLQATSCAALDMPTSSEVLQAILEYIYTDESPTIKGKPPGAIEQILRLSVFWYRYVLRIRSAESLKVEFVCNVLVVADQLLITRLKEMCEVVITENCKFIFFSLSFQPVLADKPGTV